MIFKTVGERGKPAILFFHAMGVTGDSSRPVADCLGQDYFCILPTATVYCAGQTYVSKADELRQLREFLQQQDISKLELVAASSLGADLATAFLAEGSIPVEHVFFDGGQFAQISRPLRSIMVPFLYLAIKSLYWSKGKTLKHILWCDDDAIKPYFIEAGKNLTYGNLRRQMAESVENKPFPPLPEALQQKTFFAFGSVEEHYKYRDAVRRAYPKGNFPVFEGMNHMQFQIRDPQGFARMLRTVIAEGKLSPLPFLQKGDAFHAS